MKQSRFLILYLALAVLFGDVDGFGAMIRSSQIVGYDTGNLGADVNTGQQDQWFVVGNAGSITVTNGAGSLDGAPLGLVGSAGDRVFIGAINSINASRNQFVANGTFPSNVDTNIYYSFLYKFNNAADVGDADPSAGEPMVRVNRANSGTGTAQHWDLLARNEGGAIQLGISKAGAPNNVTNWATTNITAGQTIFVVVRQHILPGVQNDVYDLWINPSMASFGATEENLPEPSASVGAQETDGAEDQSNTGPGRFALGSGLNAEFDEFRIASTWAEVTPPIGQCTSAGIDLEPVDVTQSAELSAKFEVGATGTSPKIQWQRSANAGEPWRDIPDATTASYTTSPLTLAESGTRFRAIVTVACDSSSATSVVAVATLSAPVETPAGLVLHDTFLDPDLGFDDRSNPPLSSTNSLWYTSATDNLTAFQQGGNLLATPVAGGSSLWLGYYTEVDSPPIHLAVGRALKVTLPFTPNSYTAFTANSRLRIGLFDYADGGVRITADAPAAGGSRGNGRGVRGYLLNLDFGPTFGVASPLQILARSFLDDDNLMGSIGDFTSLGSGPADADLQGTTAFQAGVEYNMELTVARKTVDSVDITASISGGGSTWSHTVTDTNYVYRRFDSIALRPNSLETSADGFTFPELKVEVTGIDLPIGSFNITKIEQTAADSIKLTWDSQTGVTYRIVSTPSLEPVSWSTNATIVATGAQTAFTHTPVIDSQRFYRVHASR